MTSLGWIASVVPFSYYARARNGALLVAMLFLACALSYTRAHAGAPAAAMPGYPISSARDLIVAMRTNDPAVQKAAKAVLERAEPAMIDELLRFGPTPGRRESAQKVVVAMGRKALPVLFSRMDDAEVGGAAASVMFRIIGPADAGRIPDLLACAREKPAVKNYCIQALIPASGPKAAPHTAALARALASEDPILRAFAATALGRIGKGAAAASPALRKALKDPVPEVRAQAKVALRKTGA